MLKSRWIFCFFFFFGFCQNNFCYFLFPINPEILDKFSLIFWHKKFKGKKFPFRCCLHYYWHNYIIGNYSNYYYSINGKNKIILSKLFPFFFSFSFHFFDFLSTMTEFYKLFNFVLFYNKINDKIRTKLPIFFWIAEKNRIFFKEKIVILILERKMIEKSNNIFFNFKLIN